MVYDDSSIRYHVIKPILSQLKRESYELLPAFADVFSRYDDSLIITGLGSLQRVAQEDDPTSQNEINIKGFLEACFKLFNDILLQIVEKNITNGFDNFVKFFSCLVQGDNLDISSLNSVFTIYLGLFSPESKLVCFALNF